jgi:1,4-alpha-glucan branching enzyme
MNDHHAPVGELDSYLFFEGTHTQSYGFMGAHGQGESWDFIVWAPNARQVSVVGDFNEWDYMKHPMQRIHENGLWYCHVDGAEEGSYYQFALRTPEEEWIFKSDPYARRSALRPNTASRLTGPDNFAWTDADWMARRAAADHRHAPMSIYEVHPGSWKRTQDNAFLNYRTLADELCPYVKRMGYTHVELMPQCEFPLDDSWGYQITGFFSVNSRHGDPADLKYLIDRFHAEGIGVIMDFVPAHFCKDAHGLRRFDGMPCYEYGLAVRGEHPQWGTCVFDYGRNEVRSFLSSAANYWASEFHIDALRFDAVSSMLYHDYGRRDSEWLPNIHGGRENLEAISLLRFINDTLHKQHAGFICIAEESTAWPLVTQPPYAGGLGFDYKWDMGWMNDTLHYMQDDPVFHPYHHSALTFSMMYAFSENFILPLSHDEVVHGKRTLLAKMPGGYRSQFAQLRLLLGYQFTHPGKKLNFMGTELAPFQEWRFYESLEWHLLNFDQHRGIQEYCRALNHLYTEHPALYARDDSWEGYRWLNANDADRSVLSYLRSADNEELVVLCNFSPVCWKNYQVPLPQEGELVPMFCSERTIFGGDDVDLNVAMLDTPVMDMPCGFCLDVPAFSMIVLAYERKIEYNKSSETGVQKKETVKKKKTKLA